MLRGTVGCVDLPHEHLKEIATLRKAIFSHVTVKLAIQLSSHLTLSCLRMIYNPVFHFL